LVDQTTLVTAVLSEAVPANISTAQLVEIMEPLGAAMVSVGTVVSAPGFPGGMGAGAGVGGGVGAGVGEGVGKCFAGVFRVNARVRAGYLGPGDLEVIVTVGASSTPAGVKVWVE
jgi:hypothetical protein